MSKFVVVDSENEAAVGTFDSKEEAKAYFIKMSHDEGWGDVQELIEETESPFVSETGELGHIYGQLGLVLMELIEPEPSVRSKITY